MRNSDCNSNDCNAQYQIFGVLTKRPFGHSSNKWSRRFFMIKDGFLLYYQENERKEFEKHRNVFNIHPKGVIPLGGCTVTPVTEAGHPFSIDIKNTELPMSIIIAAESEYERELWMNTLRQSSRITWNHAQLGDTMIEQLERQGLEMALEKQEYFDKLQNEAMALHDEKQKTEELERLNEALEKERKKIESLAEDLRDEYKKMKEELQDTLDSMKSVEDEKQQLTGTTQQLQATLEELECEKKKALACLNQEQSQAQKLSEEKQHLSEATASLTLNLQDIEQRTKKLLEEKAEAESRLHEREAKAQQLEQEKQAINEHAQELQESLRDLVSQKAVTEAELKVEVMARLDAERRLQEAEISLNRLEKAVNRQGGSENERTLAESQVIHAEMITDVGTLKRFFEDLAFEAKLDSDKSVMIKNSLHARKSMVRRAKTMKFEASRKRRSKDDFDEPWSPSDFEDGSFFPESPLALVPVSIGDQI